MLSPMVSMNMFCIRDKEMVAIALTPLPLPLLNQVTHPYSAPTPSHSITLTLKYLWCSRLYIMFADSRIYD